MPPPERLDFKGLEKETQRLVALGRADIDAVQLVNCMVYAKDIKYLRDFCVFNGRTAPTIDEMTPKVALALEEIIFGPRPENFIPIVQGTYQGASRRRCPRSSSQFPSVVFLLRECPNLLDEKSNPAHQRRPFDASAGSAGTGKK